MSRVACLFSASPYAAIPRNRSREDQGIQFRAGKPPLGTPAEVERATLQELYTDTIPSSYLATAVSLLVRELST